MSSLPDALGERKPFRKRRVARGSDGQGRPPSGPGRPPSGPRQAPETARASITAAAADERGRPAGWRIVAAKELADHLLSVRFLVLVVILGLATIGTVYAAASGINEAAPVASGTPGLFLRLFTFSAQPDRFPPFFVLFALLGPLLGIAFGFDAVSSERSEGTLPRLLSQPIHRDDVINGKFAAGLAVIGLILLALTVLVAGVGLLRLAIVPRPEEVLRMAIWLVVAVLYVGAWLAFATLCSVALRRAATSALVAISSWVALTLFATLLVSIVANVLAPLPADATALQELRNAEMQTLLARLSPGTLFVESTTVLLDPTVRATGIILTTQLDRAVAGTLSLDQSLLVVWPQVVGLLAVTAVCFAGAYIAFMRQEVRA